MSAITRPADTMPHPPAAGPVMASDATLRDEFAKAALPIAYAKYAEGHADGWGGIARLAFNIADAMLRARGAA